jgi:hypothetical protein
MPQTASCDMDTKEKNDMSDIDKFEHRTFEELRHVMADGSEYWSARELYPILGYSTWQKFEPVIQKAVIACKNVGADVNYHFNRTVKMAHLGAGAQKEMEDYHISRYGCYLVIQNCDPSKPVIAAGQTYFAVQTRRQELADEERFVELSEDKQRLMLRGEMKEHNKQLVSAAKNAGVETTIEYAVFQKSRIQGVV